MTTATATDSRWSWLWPLGLCVVSAVCVACVEPDQQLLVAILWGLSMGLAFVRRERALWNLCVSDPLTGLANRRGFHARAGKELDRLRRSHGSLALMLVDCDHFKQINDGYGHPVGDRALTQVAASLKACVRADDIVARWGGDEFVVLLRDADELIVKRVAARVNAHLRLAASLPPGLSLSVSCGGVVRNAAQLQHVRLGGLMLAADSAMYAAKKRGGGQLVSWSEPSLAPFDFEQLTPPIQAG